MAEAIALFAGVTGRRQYVWYVSGTQHLADQHVDSISIMLESSHFEFYFPVFTRRQLSKYGHARGWRRNRLRTAGGYTVDAIGLDVSIRGMKIEEQRPDLIILDDIDTPFSSEQAVDALISKLTGSIIPAGSSDLAILCIQNLVDRNGFFGRLANGKADYLHDHIMSGPFPAVEGLAVERQDGRYAITGGRATWEGQSLEICERQINDWGLTAFLAEAQHEIRDTGSLFDGITFRHAVQAPDFVRVIVVVDPATTTGPDSDCHGIACLGLADNDEIWIIDAIERIMTPRASMELAIRMAHTHGAREVHVETNNGGMTWSYLFDRIVEDLGIQDYAPVFKEIKSSSGKMERANLLLAEYERDKVVHATGKHELVEAGLRRFPVSRPLDLVDAIVHGVHILRRAPTWLLS
jgi:hypothetical protein